MAARAVPFLMFQPPRGPGAEEAMTAWTALFDDGEILSVQRHTADGPAGPDAAGTVMIAEFVLAGQRFRCGDSPPVHEWGFTPAVSVWVDCASADEQGRVFAALAEGGQELMPLGDYGFGPFGWVQDRFGVSWQLAAPA
ncbi:VOC family protein [Pseudonocardia phyllosphaerae]|uniref:VOC family protein n=1 Tax=Pseudonocardia phyllosphaerae TaxID=3390502 RepID=UPI00397981A8